MTATSKSYEFDRFLRYEEMTAWLRATAAAHPNLMSVDCVDVGIDPVRGCCR